MAKTVSDFFWERLSAWGVKRIFRFPGDGINGLIGALDRARDKLGFRSGASWGDGRLYGLWPCQIYR